VLLEIIADSDRSSARSALQALSESRFRNDVRERARSAVHSSGDRQLVAAFTVAFAQD
jgi:hypothetical protein